MFSKTLSFLSSRSVNDQVSHQYKTTHKIIVLYILIFKNLPCLQNDKQQDGRSTNICLTRLLLAKINGWIWQVKLGTEENCNIFTKYTQNNNSFKLFKHEKKIIHSKPLLCFRSQNNAFRSIYISWLAQFHRPKVTGLLGGLWRNDGWRVGKCKHLSFTPKYADKFWHPPRILLNKLR